MKRRELLKWIAAAPTFGTLLANLPAAAWAEAVAARPPRRVRPGEPGWPTASEWDNLNKKVGGRLMKLADPLAACRADPSGKACSDFFTSIRNPYYVLDNANLTQTSGWFDAWTSKSSAYAVAAINASDVAAAVNFAREHRLRLVVKGTGHSYQGTSDAPDSLLVWTHHMQGLAMHDAFVPHDCGGKVAPQPAVSIGAGQIWGHTYNAVTTKHERYVQGGGCLTVGVAGLISSGGFGSWSKRYGSAAGNLLEAEVVTADGKIRVVNACNDPDLFWALKGGGGGSFGVITRVTLRTHTLPKFFGVVNTTIKAKSDDAYRRLIAYFVDFYRNNLFNPHWGETVHFRASKYLHVNMLFQGLNKAQAEEVWKPFFDFVQSEPKIFTIMQDPQGRVLEIPARMFWNPRALRKVVPGAVVSDPRPNAPIDNIAFAGDVSQSGHYITGYDSVWLPASLLEENQQTRLVDALFEMSRHYVELHFNKGLAGAHTDAIASTRDTAMNPKVLDAFALAITGGYQPPAFLGISGHEPNLAAARRDATSIAAVAAQLRKLVPSAGSYVSESDYFLKDWQHAFWGPNYARLLRAKQRYDPQGLFTVHHGVGSEGWSADGFNRIA